MTNLNTVTVNDKQREIETNMKIIILWDEEDF